MTTKNFEATPTPSEPISLDAISKENVQGWIGAVGAKTAFIEPGSPWENGYCESFNARFELLPGNRTVTEATI